MIERTIITRAEAKAQGLTRYYTGVPCKHGHVCERRTHNGECLECLKPKARENARRWRSQHPRERRVRSLTPRQIAQQHGLPRYYTGKPCRRGHVCERIVHSERCVECEQDILAAKRAYNRRYYIENLERERERHRIVSRNYNAKYPERVKETERRWRAANFKTYLERNRFYAAMNRESARERARNHHATTKAQIKLLEASGYLHPTDTPAEKLLILKLCKQAGVISKEDVTWI